MPTFYIIAYWLAKDMEDLVSNPLQPGERQIYISSVLGECLNHQAIH